MENVYYAEHNSVNNFNITIISLNWDRALDFQYHSHYHCYTAPQWYKEIFLTLFSDHSRVTKGNLGASLSEKMKILNRQIIDWATITSSFSIYHNNKFIFPFLRSGVKAKRGVEFSHWTQHAMPPKFGRKWGTACRNTRFPLLTLL